MTIENFKEVTDYFETNKDSEEVKGYIGGLNPVTPDRATAFLDTEDGKRLLQPKLDTYHSKSLESWKTNNVPKLVDEEVNKRFPKADPRDIALAKITSDFEAMKNEAARKDLTFKALKTATEKKLPTDLIDFFVGNDEETTSKNLEKFIATMAAHDEAIKTEFAKSNSYTPPKDKGDLGKEEETARAEIAKYMHK
jgi:hypothetical protein